MPPTLFDEVCNYGFADKGLALRKRAGLNEQHRPQCWCERPHHGGVGGRPLLSRG